MADSRLDPIDRRIIYELQRDARHTSASEIAESLDVSARTVRNHIDRLEERGVIEGYDVSVNYETAGYQLHTVIVCTAPIPQREALARRALEGDGVVAVREGMTGEENLHVEVVGVVRRPGLSRRVPRLNIQIASDSDPELQTLLLYCSGTCGSYEPAPPSVGPDRHVTTESQRAGDRRERPTGRAGGR
ncbi:hypothetical protein BRD18_08500 [Halobacteriales archaeon SW_7_71_33]|nr:MAG: hypothetical protein BRD18_08500 [Halobacteriales archaeon SW_7_71_33]